jgi:hypothetical protein
MVVVPFASMELHEIVSTQSLTTGVQSPVFASSVLASRSDARLRGIDVGQSEVKPSMRLAVTLRFDCCDRPSQAPVELEEGDLDEQAGSRPRTARTHATFLAMRYSHSVGIIRRKRNG